MKPRDFILVQVSKNRWQVVRLGKTGGAAWTKPLDEVDAQLALNDIKNSLDDANEVQKYLLGPTTTKCLRELQL